MVIMNSLLCPWEKKARHPYIFFKFNPVWKVWNMPHFTDFFTDFEKKNNCFAVYDGITKI